MDLFHRKPEHTDPRTGRECSFCSTMDPDFPKRRAIDRMVLDKLEDTAAAHISEDGYVRHRIAELKRRHGSTYEVPLQRSA